MKYVVNLNGKNYEVEVTEQEAVITNITAGAAAPVAAPAGAETISAPMPGTILDVKVAVGADVKKGDNLVILEAMKMENEIKAPRDGKVASVNVTKGATVNSGDVLVTLA